MPLMNSIKKIGIPAIGIVFALGAGIGASYLFPIGVADANAIVEKCEADQNKTRCYEHEVPTLFPQYSIADIFGVIREIRRLDPSYQFCHVLAHKLGEAIVAEDPSKWLDAMSQNPPNSLCSNGFIHGVIVGRFRNDILDETSIQEAIPDFRRACEPRSSPAGEWHPSRLDQAICYHGMGHLFTFITNADLRRALDICDAVGESDTGSFFRVCREGVFMQIYQPLEPDDFELVAQLPIKPTKENYRRFCA
ncbi:MAG: hypothetical protein Q8R25_02210, partial [bacterium]|nr:hypothetical protein [bacterium]